jgi:hypothetical protein
VPCSATTVGLPRRGIVHDVIVDERRDVKKFQSGTCDHRILVGTAGRFTCKRCQHRPNPLSSRHRVSEDPPQRGWLHSADGLFKSLIDKGGEGLFDDRCAKRHCHVCLREQ